MTPEASARTSPRCARGASVAARAAIASSGDAGVEADGQRRRGRWPGCRGRPAASRAGREPSGVATSAAMPRMPRDRDVRRRHVGRPIARRTSPCGRRTRAARATTRASPALATSTASASAPSRISALASAIASTDGKCSRCASPTLVQTRTSGSAIADQRADLAGRAHPQLHDGHAREPRRRGRARAATAAGRCGCSGCRGSGTSGAAAPGTPRSTSFVVVLPADPVIATTRAPLFRRIARAHPLQRQGGVRHFDDDRRRAAAAASRSPAVGRARSATTTPAAPRSSASPTKA